MVNNQEFLSAIFGADYLRAHVTDFTHDPAHIPADQHLIAWSGDYFGRYRFKPQSNQYFTISLFHPDSLGKARRRKALYDKTPCIVLDDVKEKLSMSEVARLPDPSWILQTSPGSEQWGYILNTPCTDRSMVENLLDGLVANGLAPDGKDPGMKGVTRYVRLPDGYNTKQSKMINGQPNKCQMLHWSPFSTVTIEELAAPFHVDLYKVRREARVDGAASVEDHPLLQIPDLVHIKEVRSAGRFDITCPWVEEHTDEIDNGTAIFTNADGTIGFKCHHGTCQSRTGGDLLQWIEQQQPGFKQTLISWQMRAAFSKIDKVTPAPLQPVTVAAPEPTVDDTLNQMMRNLRAEIPGSSAAVTMTEVILKAIDQLPVLQQVAWHNQVRDLLNWDKRTFDKVIKDLRSQWYSSSKKDDINFYDSVIYVAEQNQFFDRKKRLWYSADAYQNTYAHLDPEARKEALQGGRVMKVDRVDFAPLKPAIFQEAGITYGNSWDSESVITEGIPGDATPWLRHFDVLGWSAYRDHVIKWMAWTLRHPDVKINHMILLGSGEGCGKDWLMYPLTKAMGNNYNVIAADELLENFNSYLLSTKYLHINEAELGDRSDAIKVSSKLKPLCAAPPEKLRINEKNMKHVLVRNIASVSMSTNSLLPVRLMGDSRRILGLWSDLRVRDSRGEMTPEWLEYWNNHWYWMLNGGAEVCINYLNHVDLSQFNPGAPPPVTDYLRSIVAASRTPVQQLITSLIENRIAAFTSDVVTTESISFSMRQGAMRFPDMIQILPLPQGPRLGVAMRELGHTGVQVMKEGIYTTLWVIRNHEQYVGVSGEQLLDKLTVAQSNTNVIPLRSV